MWVFVLIVVVILAAATLYSQISILKSRLDGAERTLRANSAMLEKLKKQISSIEVQVKIEQAAKTAPKIKPAEVSKPSTAAPKPVDVPKSDAEPSLFIPPGRAVISPIPAGPPLSNPPTTASEPFTPEPLLPPLVEPVIQAVVADVSPPGEMAQDSVKKSVPVPPVVGDAPKTVRTEPSFKQERQDNKNSEEKHPETPVFETAQWASLELLIGRKVILWVAMGLFVLVASYFIKYAVENHWITDRMKVGGIGLFGAIFLAAGKYFSLTGLRRLSTAVTSTGICIVFMAGYSSYAYFNLVPMKAAFVMMSVIVIGGFLLSVHYLSRLIGVIAVFSGLAVPVLVSSGIDLYVQFFAYLVILNLGTLILINLIKRAPIACVAFFGTQMEFWLWYGRDYEPEKLAAVIGFQACLYGLYLIDTMTASLLPRQKANWDDAVRAVISPLIFGSVLWYFLRNHEIYEERLGMFSFAFAAFYAILAVISTRHLRRLWDPAVEARYSQYWKAGPVAATVIAFVFVAAGIPLQLKQEWIALGWFTAACGLWVASHRLNHKTFYFLSAVFHVLGLVRFSFVDFPVAWHFHRLTPSLCLGSLLMLSAFLANRSIAESKDPSREHNLVWNRFFALEGIAIVWVMLSLKCWQYFRTHHFIFWPETGVTVRLMSHAMLPVLWTLLSSVILLTGIVSRSKWLRMTGLAGFLLVTAKLYLFQLFIRPDYSRIGADTIAWNPWFVTLLIPAAVMMSVSVWQTRFSQSADNTERESFRTLGLSSLVIFWVMISVECFTWVWAYAAKETDFTGMLRCGTPWTVTQIATFTDSPYGIPFSWGLASLSLLWTLFGTLLILIGVSARSESLRVMGVVVFAVTSLKIYCLELAVRFGYETPLWNGYFMPVVVPVILMIVFAVLLPRYGRMMSSQEKRGFSVLGLNGLLLFWIAASVECYCYFSGDAFENWGDPAFIARNTLSVFWTVLAAGLVITGVVSRSQILRCLGILGFAVVSLVVYGFQIWDRTGIACDTVLWNSYFMPIAFIVICSFLVSIGMTRFHPLKDTWERNGFLVIGLNALLMVWWSLSVECFWFFGHRLNLPFDSFTAHASLSIFWTFLSLGLILAGWKVNSDTVRYAGFSILVLTFFKVMPFELSSRPRDLYPFLNPFTFSMFLLAVTIMFTSVLTLHRLPAHRNVERHVVRTFGFCGLALLWFSSSLECRASMMTLQGDGAESVRQAQMALSILWAVFGGVLIMVGFLGKSAVLRWLAILLFAVTNLKVITVDMQGLNGLYRICALLPLAVVLFFVAWAYQRFKPERKPPT